MHNTLDVRMRSEKEKQRSRQSFSTHLLIRLLVDPRRLDFEMGFWGIFLAFIASLFILKFGLHP
jgi:hypothetical protein